MALCLLSGPASIVQARNIGLLDLAPKTEGELYVHQLDHEHRLFFHGDFSGFHAYALVTHTKFKVIKDSVALVNQFCFKAKLIYENINGEELSEIVTFRSPIFPISAVTACKYGREYDCFEFSFAGQKVKEKFPCDLVFVTQYAEDLSLPIPLCIEYIGMAAKNGRTALDRLGEGHEKLQALLAQLSDRDLFRNVSIILYKPGELDCDGITFEQVVETFEASLIQHYKPKPLNIEHLNFPQNRTKLTSTLKDIGANELLVVVESPELTTIYSRHRPEPMTHELIYLRVS
ncbi:hypothetical protein NTH40_001403 [Vibrio harveyi]|uniref:hypothetical protein n=1 Tax=Vibrio harveyi TaxID=669 RepID=UPI002A325611|nr:hypothetical protein [Vibrio harveyi]